MAGKNELELILGLDNRRLKHGLRQGKTMISNFSRGARASISSVGGALGIGIAGAGAMKMGAGVVAFDAKLKRLEIQSERSGREMLRLRENLNQTAFDAGQNRSDVLAGIDAIVERTGNMDFASQVMKDLGIAASGTGAEMKDLGALSSQLNQKFNISPDQLMMALDILVSQGKEGAFTLENLAALSERLFASAGRLDMTGIDDLKRVGAFAQIARMGTGSSEQATTSVERVFSNILAKQKQIKKLGFDIRDKNGNIKKLDVLLKGIIKAANGDEAILSKIFGEEGVRSVSILAKSYRETNGFSLFDKLVESGNAAGTVMRDFNKYSESSAHTFKQLKVLGELFSEKVMSGGVDEVAKSLNEFLSDPDEVSEMADAITEISKAVVLLGKALGIAIENWELTTGAALTAIAAFKGLPLVGALAGNGATVSGGAAAVAPAAVPALAVAGGIGATAGVAYIADKTVLAPLKPSEEHRDAVRNARKLEQAISPQNNYSGAGSQAEMMAMARSGRFRSDDKIVAQLEKIESQLAQQSTPQVHVQVDVDRNGDVYQSDPTLLYGGN